MAKEVGATELTNPPFVLRRSNLRFRTARNAGADQLRFRSEGAHESTVRAEKIQPALPNSSKCRRGPTQVPPRGHRDNRIRDRYSLDSLPTPVGRVRWS